MRFLGLPGRLASAGAAIGRKITGEVDWKEGISVGWRRKAGQSVIFRFLPRGKGEEEKKEKILLTFTVEYTMIKTEQMFEWRKI